MLFDGGRLGRQCSQRLRVVALHRLEELSFFPADVVVQPDADLPQEFGVVRGCFRIALALLRQSPERPVLVQQALP